MINTRRWWKSPAVLFVVFAMVVALGGLAYAHWTTTSQIQADVQTGGLQMGWMNAGTSDDGIPVVANDPDAGGGTDYDGWPGPCGGPNEPPCSSDDPNNGDNPFSRYTKDVGGCWAWAQEGDSNLQVEVQNAYPSYYCHVFADAFNYGSVPVMAAGLRISGTGPGGECYAYLSEADRDNDENRVDIVPFDGDEFIDLGGTPGEFDEGTDGWRRGNETMEWADVGGEDGVFDDGDVEVWSNCFGVPLSVTPAFTPSGALIEGAFYLDDVIFFNITDGIVCGTQVDPGEGMYTAGYLHVEQPAEQGTGYQFTIEQDWVNWNEFDAGRDCTINDLPIPQD
jgi:hypothetical protein